MKFNRRRVILAILLISIQAVPYLLAALRWQPVWVFNGFLLNPIDGNSYLAKMQEGWAGGWRFTDLYTAHASQGAYLFLFYIGLGHLARLFNLSLLVIFHLARLLAGLGLLGVLSIFCDQVFGDDTRKADLAFGLVCLGSGMGWLAALGWGALGGDFWIAEAYPFLSMYANPHFPLGLTLVLGMLLLDLGPARPWKGPLLALLGLLLSSVQPFGFVLAGFLLCATLAGRLILRMDFRPGYLIWGMSLGGLFLLYQYWAILKDPVLSAWNIQNLTPAPPLGDFLLSLSPALLLAAAGIVWAWKRKELPWLVLIAWLVGCSLMVYLPVNLQRRFMTGLYIPVALLGIAGAGWLEDHLGKVRRWLIPGLFICSLLTNILVLASGLAGGLASEAGRPNPKIFFSQAEAHAMDWIRSNTAPGSVFLAPEQSGLVIPAWTGRRVVYGHPFETADAQNVKKSVDAFIAAQLSNSESSEFLKAQAVNYLYYPPTLAGGAQTGSAISGTVVYDQDGVTIIQVNP